jgi:hypothetical protein
MIGTRHSKIVLEPTSPFRFQPKGDVAHMDLCWALRRLGVEYA